MRRLTSVGVVVVIVCSGLAAFAQTTAQTAQTGRSKTQSRPKGPTSWLDRPLTNWNATLTEIPDPVIDKWDVPMPARCEETHRSGASPEDKLLTRAGWTLYGQEQQFDDVALVTALSNADAQCRPLDYQAFVFVGGKLAGTVSPKPMDARTDGSAAPIHLTSSSTLTVAFSRYTASDAMCCPSRRQIVTYTIERSGPRPLLVPRTVTSMGRERDQ